jgi:hypothetical protein
MTYTLCHEAFAMSFVFDILLAEPSSNIVFAIGYKEDDVKKTCVTENRDVGE